MPGWEWVGVEEAAMVQAVFDSGGVLMPHGFDGYRSRFFVREFEEACKLAFGSPYCQAVSSGTAATRVALQALGIGHGDEVITQAFNFISTVEAIRDVGANPVLVNCNRDLHIDLEEVERKISSRTRAVAIVHMLGVPGPLSDLVSLCRRRGIALVEDACEAVGARSAERCVGTIGDVGIFSFDHGKMVSTGEGGLVLTNSEDVAFLARAFHDHGHAYDEGVPRNLDSQVVAGFNFRMSELQAAVGIAQLRKLPDMLSANRARVSSFLVGLSERHRVRGSRLNDEPTHDTVVLTELSPRTQERVIETLRAQSLGTKNLPDALRWHFAGYWDKLLDRSVREDLSCTSTYLTSSVAIPILLSRSVEFYHDLGYSLSKLS